MTYREQQRGESWRVYTKRLAKLNNTSRRRVVRWLRRMEAEARR
jgi:hypothetical protein